MQQQILGYHEMASTNLHFVRICTKPFELRSTTKLKLDSDGRLVKALKKKKRNGGSSISTSNGLDGNRAPDSQSEKPPCDKAHTRKGFQVDRRMTHNQGLLYGGNVICGSCDMTTRYSLHPVELLELITSLGAY